MTSLRQTINTLDKTHRINLCRILKIDEKKYSAKSIAQKINGLYHRRSTAVDYETLIEKAAKKLNVYDKKEEATVPELEQYIVQAVIVESLHNMTAKQRNVFFTQAFDLADVFEKANIQNTGLRGPITILTAIGVGNSLGFGTYLAATTALGFVTHGVGITLPFTAYLGLTSTISVVLGPAGIAGAALWAGWILNSPKWEKIIPALLYILTQKYSIPENQSDSVSKNYSGGNADEGSDKISSCRISKILHDALDDIVGSSKTPAGKAAADEAYQLIKKILGRGEISPTVEECKQLKAILQTLIAGDFSPKFVEVTQDFIELHCPDDGALDGSIE